MQDPRVSGRAAQGLDCGPGWLVRAGVAAASAVLVHPEDGTRHRFTETLPRIVEAGADEDAWTALIRDHLVDRKGHATHQRLRTDPAGTPSLRV